MQLVKGVFKGGGAKGALYTGALQAVEEHGIWFSELAGSSAGAITASFVAAGARPDDLRRLDGAGRDILRFPSTMACAMNLRNAGGILSFEKLRDWLAESLNELCERRLGMTGVDVNGPTFTQLVASGGIPLHIACADLMLRAPVVFNADLTPELYVAHAAAASSSIPFVFEAPMLRGADDVAIEKVVVSDGGVMANLPMFVFTDKAYRSVAGLGDPSSDRVVGFTLVDPEAPSYRGASGEVGKEYRDRFEKVLRTTLLGEELRAAGIDSRHVKEVRDPKSKSPRRWSPGRFVALLLVAVLRVIEVVVVIPINAVLGLTQWRGYRSSELTASNRRARRWIKFADRITGLAGGAVVAGVLLVIPVLVFGVPAVLEFLWPDWHTNGTSGAQSIVAAVITGLLYLLIAIGVLLVVVFTVLGLVGYLAAWVAKPVALSVGDDVLATFMRNPQEPAWAGAGGEDVIIRIDVPKGWNALHAASSDAEMNAALEYTSRSVGEQLEHAGLGAKT